jgi:hypothetical protein
MPEKNVADFASGAKVSLLKRYSLNYKTQVFLTNVQAYNSL